MTTYPPNTFALPCVIHPDICYVEPSRLGSAAAVTSASAAAAAEAAVAARMVLIGGWSGDGRSVGREEEIDRLAGDGRAAVRPAARQRRPVPMAW